MTQEMNYYGFQKIWPHNLIFNQKGRSLALRPSKSILK